MRGGCWRLWEIMVWRCDSNLASAFPRRSLLRRSLSWYQNAAGSTTTVAAVQMRGCFNAHGPIFKNDESAFYKYFQTRLQLSVILLSLAGRAPLARNALSCQAKPFKRPFREVTPSFKQQACSERKCRRGHFSKTKI